VILANMKYDETAITTPEISIVVLGPRGSPKLTICPNLSSGMNRGP
jgi:hypothetical protein